MPNGGRPSFLTRKPRRPGPTWDVCLLGLAPASLHALRPGTTPAIAASSPSELPSWEGFR